MEYTLRPATPDDADSIARIYNDAVISSTASFDVAPQPIGTRRVWLTDRDARHPVIVAETDDGHVVAWASLSRWSERPAYDATVEMSIYVDDAARRQGLGRALMAKLLDVAPSLGVHSVISRIVVGNEGSIRLSEQYGFCEVGVMHECGRKFGRWLDVVILEKVLETSHI